MEFAEVIKSRYSVRKFDARPVEPEKLELILQAGRVAPTAGNSQPQRVLVVQGEEGLAKLRPCTPCHFDAPVVLLVCYQTNPDAKVEGFRNGDFSRVDASIVMTYMMLQATDLGLGSCWVGLYSDPMLREAFAIPAQYGVLSLLPLGYPAEDAAPRDMHFQRLPLGQTVFMKKF